MNLCKLGIEVVKIEAQAVSALIQRIDINFENACNLLSKCQGRVIVAGLGKSGHIARKLASTFSSTGTPAIFMHLSEASHGDFGVVTKNDVMLIISYSGNTDEINTLLPLIKKLNIPLIALTGNKHSLLARYADVNLDVSINQEACSLGLAPTTSTTVALVMGDALAITLLQMKGFSKEDFAYSHPSGSLGKRLLLRVDDIWHSGKHLPIVNAQTLVKDAILEVTAKRLGMTCVVDDIGVLIGIYTDGDIRRTLLSNDDFKKLIIVDVMTNSCKIIKAGTLVADAFTLMQKYSITALIIVDDQHKPVAVVHLHDLLKALNLEIKNYG